MLGQLNNAQSDEMLHREQVGRIGCYADDAVYVVPVSYAYDGACIYAHSREGKKVEMMRKNPKICFEIDSMENLANWRGVILWGRYEELSDPKEQERGMQLLMDRFAPMISSETAHPHQGMQAPGMEEKKHKAVVFQIVIEERSGRFEKSN